ncbi:MAG: hypothetical protein B7Y11_12790 [Sphingobacteriia bacterium 24-36-13]|nr:MAG: hypothetical protein B7Y66_04600 [Sphingobacteriia bacterium 35-36-14]OYZ51998.1 MAG: hypothetical protein B7Y11_12790 [Sphingobacteriia bacterium 24-36-13]OZA65032.1 MAG: hypothetical protein B7X68_05200 [Sphingobacteriia bacterium 39-36-14]
MVTEALSLCSATTLDKTIAYKDNTLSTIGSFLETVSAESDKGYFLSLQLFFKSLFQLIEAYQLQSDGKPGFSDLIAAVKLNVSLFTSSIAEVNNNRPSIIAMVKVAEKMNLAKNIHDVIAIAKDTLQIGFATMITSEFDSRGKNSKNKPDDYDVSPEEKEQHLIVSVRFYFDNELWANPQTIKPNVRYNLSGEIKLNEWPEGYEKLTLSAVTTTDDSHFVLSLPEIQYTGNKSIPIEGSIIVKYPQPLFEKPMAIRMLARFTAQNKITLYPLIIGYDQLILKAVDNEQFLFPTGYSKLNQKALEIIGLIKKEVLDLPDSELEHFSILLSGILNYQGFCAEHSEYKAITSLTEDQFRNNMIKYLSARNDLAGQVIKESHIAGGRVEIRFKEIIAELKVERSISDREKVMSKYERQPVVYASATSAQVAILCILDLTAKTRPPAIANNNVFLRKVPVHGQTDDSNASHVVVVFIDGNIPNPSHFSA